jgi:hypothetical protein
MVCVSIPIFASVLAEEIDSVAGNSGKQDLLQSIS